ncbi:hypothetical protein GCM10022291_22410 [Postechiella marina]|uniref:Uncharacterized protein n=2 Tax=Postechiella marina TaxID=943941 RepID=A0ABP8CBT1_9FLAO
MENLTNLEELDSLPLKNNPLRWGVTLKINEDLKDSKSLKLFNKYYRNEEYYRALAYGLTTLSNTTSKRIQKKIAKKVDQTYYETTINKWNSSKKELEDKLSEEKGVNFVKNIQLLINHFYTLKVLNTYASGSKDIALTIKPINTSRLKSLEDSLKVAKHYFAEKYYSKALELESVADSKSKWKNVYTKYIISSLYEKDFQDVQDKMDLSRDKATVSFFISPLKSAYPNQLKSLTEEELNSTVIKYRLVSLLDNSSADFLVKLMLVDQKAGVGPKDPVIEKYKKTVKDGKDSSGSVIKKEVTAEVTRYERYGSGFVDIVVEVVNNKTGEIILSKKCIGSSQWNTLWYSYTGDRRAIKSVYRMDQKKAKPDPSNRDFISWAINDAKESVSKFLTRSFIIEKGKKLY